MMFHLQGGGNHLMHARPRLTLIITIVFCCTLVVATSAQENEKDLAELYSKLAGDYEVYIYQTYMTLAVTVKEGVLMASLGGGEKEKLLLKDIDSLLFASEKTEEENIQFIRNDKGSFLSCRLILKDDEHLALRMSDNPRPRKFTQNELQEDLNQLRKMIEDMHPSKYVFTKKPVFDALFDQQYNKITGVMTLEEFHRIAAPVVTTIGCGHAKIKMPNNYWDSVNEKLLPIKINIVGGKAYVLDHYKSSQPIAKGNEILSINGNSISEIVETIMPAISADAHNEAAKLRRLNFFFATLYSVEFGNSDTFYVNYISNGAIKTAELKPITIDVIDEYNSEFVGLEFNILEDKNTAVIFIRTFSYYQERETFYTFVDDAFAQIKEKNIGNVILDFRGNGGGDPYCAVHLLSYLAHKPVPYFSEVYRNYEKFSEPVPLAKNHFVRKLYTLIDAGCFSTTGHLSALMKYHKIGTFIGIETGGTYTCNDASRTMELRNTRYRIKMPRKAFSVAVKDLPRNRGIIPDHHVSPSVQDVLEGKDTIMEYALDIIQKTQK